MCLVHDPVRLYELADGVAYGEDVRHVGANLHVDVSKAATLTALPPLSAALFSPSRLMLAVCPAQRSKS